MKRFLPFLLLITACSFVAPPRDTGQWESTVHGVQITWRWTAPGGLWPSVGYTHAFPGGDSCVVDIDPVLSRRELVRVAAHEAGHCLAARYLRVGGAAANANHQALLERWPERYAQAYLSACGESLRPLGWRDLTTSPCETAPHPNSVSGS